MMKNLYLFLDPVDRCISGLENLRQVFYAGERVDRCISGLEIVLGVAAPRRILNRRIGGLNSGKEIISLSGGLNRHTGGPTHCFFYFSSNLNTRPITTLSGLFLSDWKIEIGYQLVFRRFHRIISIHFKRWLIGFPEVAGRQPVVIKLIINRLQS